MASLTSASSVGGLPCDVCGEPTTSKTGVCRRTKQCNAEQCRRWRLANLEYDNARQAARRAQVRAQKQPLQLCELCGSPTWSKLGVCTGTAACAAENQRRWKDGHPEQLRESRRRRRQERLEQERARARGYYAENRAAKLARARQARAADPEGFADRQRRWREANQEALAEWYRKYWERTDRPCRKAAGGCTEYAHGKSAYCRKHIREHSQAIRRVRQEALAEVQHWICPWCAERLPDDLSGVHVDHIIPVSRGGPDEEWNFQLLHGKCNLAKWARLTPGALELAELHAIAITVYI